MKAVLLPAAGLQRVRIWQSIFPCSSGPAKSHLPSKFVCIDSLTNKEATTAGKKLRCMYEGIRTPASDRYCRYTIARFLHDPHAKWQHPAMFGEIVPNCGKLDKDPKGSWIVAPIVSSRALKGFISADSHEPSHTGPTERTETDPRVVMLQCYILDIISDLARYVMPV